ncbi:MAG: heparinase II/III family protein [Alphaproteobacteria bacterium]
MSEKEQFLKTKNLTKFKNGIAIYKDSYKAIFFDVIQPTNFKFHKSLSAGSLSFEISAGGEKLITNCGGSEGGGKNPSYLKYSAAHSTIIINNTNISEVKERDVKKFFQNKLYLNQKTKKMKSDLQVLIMDI